MSNADVEKCPICLEIIGETMYVRCDKHSIHIECMNSCMRLDCPVCRRKFFDRESPTAPDPEIIDLTDYLPIEFIPSFDFRNLINMATLILPLIVFLVPIFVNLITCIPSKYRIYVLFFGILVLFSYIFTKILDKYM